MSTGYVIPFIKCTDLLRLIQQSNTVKCKLQPKDQYDEDDDVDSYRLTIKADIELNLQKRIDAAIFLDIPGDDLRPPCNVAAIFLGMTLGDPHSWFVGDSAFLNSPEQVLDKVIEILHTNKINAEWISEDNEEYFDYADTDMDEEK